MKHPLHPMLVHIPIGLWVASLVFDIAYLAGAGDASFARASYYCIGLGLAGAILAAPAGFAEFVTIPAATRPKRIATAHMALNVVILALYLVSFVLLRRDSDGSAPETVTTSHFIFSLVSVGMLSVSGYLGGLLVYEHGIGFRPHERPSDRDGAADAGDRRKAA